MSRKELLNLWLSLNFDVPVASCPSVSSDVCSTEATSELPELGEELTAAPIFSCNGSVSVLAKTTSGMCPLPFSIEGLSVEGFGLESTTGGFVTAGRLTGGRLLLTKVVLPSKLLVVGMVLVQVLSPSVGVTLGSLDSRACKLDIDGRRLGMVGLVAPCGLLCPVFKDLGGDGHSGRW